MNIINIFKTKNKEFNKINFLSNVRVREKFKTMEYKDKLVENDKTLHDSANINGLLLKELINFVDEFINRKSDKAQNLGEIIKKIFYNHLKVLDKNVSKWLFALHHK